MKLLTYIGKKERYTEHLYGTNSTWAPGQTQPVGDDPAYKLLQHIDVFRLATKAEIKAVMEELAEQAPEETKPATKSPRKLEEQHEEMNDSSQDPRAHAINLKTANKQTLAKYLKEQFAYNSPEESTVQDLRIKAGEFRSARGLPQV